MRCPRAAGPGPAGLRRPSRLRCPDGALLQRPPGRAPAGFDLAVVPGRRWRRRPGPAGGLVSVSGRGLSPSAPGPAGARQPRRERPGHQRSAGLRHRRFSPAAERWAPAAAPRHRPSSPGCAAFVLAVALLTLLCEPAWRRASLTPSQPAASPPGLLRQAPVGSPRVQQGSPKGDDFPPRLATFFGPRAALQRGLYSQRRLQISPSLTVA